MQERFPWPEDLPFSQAGELDPFVVAIIVFVVFLLFFGAHILICTLLYKCFQAIPPRFRRQEPGLVWLLLIPCFPLVWNFFVHPRLAESYRDYFRAAGSTEFGECGRGVALAYCIVSLCAIIPCVNYIAGPAALVLIILFLAKAWDLRGVVLSAESDAHSR
ncbi:MAG: hypothetical protein ACE5GW_03980 [Planctomycetota bacterium]